MTDGAHLYITRLNYVAHTAHRRILRKNSSRSFKSKSRDRGHRSPSSYAQPSNSTKISKDTTHGGTYRKPEEGLKKMGETHIITAGLSIAAWASPLVACEHEQQNIKRASRDVLVECVSHSRLATFHSRSGLTKTGPSPHSCGRRWLATVPSVAALQAVRRLPSRLCRHRNRKDALQGPQTTTSSGT